MKRMLPIILAVVLAVVAAGIVFMYARGSEQRALDTQQPVPVLVSTAAIPQGMSLGDAVAGGLAEQTQVPISSRPAGAIAAVTPENTGLMALNNINPGQILLDSNFVAELPSASPLAVPDGLIAISLVLGDPQKVGTFLRPGSEIIVFDTYTSGVADATGTGPNAQPAEPILTTRTLIQNALVLGVGDATTVVVTNPDGTTAPPVPSALLTVAVDQTEAEVLIHALATGSLYLGLLGDGTEIVKSNGVTSGNLFD